MYLLCYRKSLSVHAPFLSLNFRVAFIWRLPLMVGAHLFPGINKQSRIIYNPLVPLF